VRRFLLSFVALMVLVSATASFAEAEKKGRKRRGGKKAAHHGHKADANAASGPFSDVPKGHWAYEAVQKAAEAGILQGWNGRFHGNKIVNRYQMAVVVARMLDRVGVLKANGKVITGQDIANLESLVIEFADELALLNVKVSTLEDTVAGLKKDVDLIKADMRGVGARAGITGTAQVRAVFTDDVNNAYRFGPDLPNIVGGTFFAIPPALGAFPLPAATNTLTRYRGQQTNTTSATGVPAGTFANPAVFDNRSFLTVSNFSLNIDREFDPHTHFHAQVEVNAEGTSDTASAGGFPALAGGAPDTAPIFGGFAAGLPSSGRGNSFSFGSGDIFINEAYVTFSDWFTDGVAGRLGVFALPMNTEVNGPSRTYQWTITPSVINSKWESIRPIGLDLFQHNERDSLMFYVGFFTPSDLQAGEFRSGALLGQNTGFGATSQNDGGVNFGGRFVGLPGGTTAGAAFNVGRFPTPFSGPAMTDQPRGVRGQSSFGLGEGLADDDLGYYAMIGSHPTNRGHKGLSWHVAYYDRNGDLRPGLDEDVSRTDWYAWQIAANYQWRKFLLAAQYFDGTSRNYSTQEVGAFGAVNQPDVRRANTTPFANVGALDTESQGFFALLNWQFSRRGSFTARWETASDETGAAEIQANIWTLGFNWRTSDHGWLQMEWISPDSYTRSENGVRNNIDIDDDLFQINYKYNW
jgi:hypothetical protein